MRKFGRLLLATALAFAGTAAAKQGEPAKGTTQALAREAAAFFSGQQPGGVVLVTRRDEVLLRQTYGLADIENGVAMRADATLRLASVSKQFTVSAALMLAAEGRLDLDAPPHKYVPELKPLPVTIDQMMRNSSGLPDFLELLRLGGHGLDKPARPEDLLAACHRNGHLNFTPGSRFLYSNTNFLLLGHIIERVEGKKLGEVVRELRERQGLTQAQLAERAQLALSYITLLESGQKTNLSPAVLGRLARALGVTTKQLADLPT